MRRAFLLAASATCALALAKAQSPLCVDETFQMPYAPTGSVSSIEFMVDGRILVGGYLKSPGPLIQYFGLTRLAPSGAIDPTFGPSYVQAGSGLQILGDFIYLNSGGIGFPRKFLSDGTPDNSYGTPMPEFATAQAAYFHIFPDGKQWRTGSYSRQLYDEEGNQVGSEQDYGLLQVLPDGHVDPEFDHKRTWPGWTNALRETPDGRFLLGTTSGAMYEGHSTGRVARIWPDGHLDTTFRSTIYSGRVTRNFYFYPDGRILVFGRMMAPEYPNDTLAVMRLHPDGSTDTTWPSIPFLNYGQFRGLASITDYLEIEPGKLIVVGQFNAIGDQPLGAITTIDTAGNVLWDYLPGTGAGFTEPIDNNSPSCYLQGIKEGPDGSIYIMGSFSGYNDGCGDHPEQRLITRLYPLNVGVKEEAKTEGIRVYPNPGNNLLQVAVGTNQPFEVKVRDGTGRVVLAGKPQATPLELSSGSLAAGVYLVEVIVDDVRQTVKWIKQ